MHIKSQRIIIALIFILALMSLACKRQIKSTADLPPVLSHTYTVSVAPFTQPKTPYELILGRIPEPQGLITDEDLRILDDQFKQILKRKQSRNFKFLTIPPKKPTTTYHSAAQPKGLEHWLAYGQSQGADLLLVPQVINWHEREGSAAGVTKSAWVRVEFFLLKINSGTMMNRSFYEEEQEPLTDNFLKIGQFIQRKGSWVSATDLAREGMIKACKDLGL